MSKLVSLNELRDQVRFRADMVNSQFITDAELETYINASCAELYDVLIQKFGNDYYLSSSSVSVLSGTSAYDLPSDFYKLVGVDLALTSTDTVSLRKFNWEERNVRDNLRRYVRDLRYRIRGNSVIFTPDPTSPETVTVWYIPNIKKLEQITSTNTAEASTTTYTVASHNFVANDVIKGSGFTPAGFNVEQTVSSVTSTTVVTNLDSSALTATVEGKLNSTFDGVSGWEEYIIVDSAMKCLQKEESDVSVLFAQKNALIQRIEAAAENRDAGEAECVQDMEAYETNTIY